MLSRNLLIFVSLVMFSSICFGQGNNPIECTNKCKEEFNIKKEKFEVWIKEQKGKNDNNQAIYIEMRRRGMATKYQECNKACFPGL